MGHGGSSPGKFYNGVSDKDVNRGCYGKLSAEQITERIDLHARRKIENTPTVADIATHWMEKYGIEMSYQSEKQWCNTATNKALIEARQDELQQSGELLKPTLQTQTLLNSLAEAAKDNAENCRNLKKRLNAAMNGDCTPWAIMGMTESAYFNLVGPRKKAAEGRVKLILQARKDALKLAMDYSKAHINMSKELRESVKQTYEMGKYLNLLDVKKERKALTAAKDTEVEEVKELEDATGATPTESDIEAARKELYGND